ncbi:MAG TPA: FKBP-type peptidyl-prolyl cis-trans isomerase [Acidobacteriaceae bacterium]
MRITSRTTNASLLCAALFAAAQLPAQTAKPAAPRTTARSGAATRTAAATNVSHAPAGGCITIPDLSPKIPSLPAGSSCPKALYTITTVPDVRLEYVNPVEGDLAKTLGLESSSFTLAYIDTKAGSGPLALPNKYYTVKYTGYLADGSVFDASDKHPDTADGITFQVGAHQVVAGWDTGFAGMHLGGKRRLFIPFQLAYGPSGRPPTIPARAELIFDMELVSQSDTPPAPKTPPAPPAATMPKPAATAPASAPAAPATTQPATPPATEAR